MCFVVKQPDGLKLQYSSHGAKVFGAWPAGRPASCRVSTPDKPTNLFPLTSQQEPCPALLSAGTSAGSGKHPVQTYLAARKGIKDKPTPQKVTKGLCMARKEKQCSFNPRAVSQATTRSSAHGADSASDEQAG